jgi:ElaB/YqjD/DUF883 family membrane-anchored ribosome-binding protein
LSFRGQAARPGGAGATCGGHHLYRYTVEMAHAPSDIDPNPMERVMKTARIDPKNVDLEFLRDEFNRFRSELSGMKDKIGVNASDALDQMSSYLNGKSVSSKLSALEGEIEALTAKLKDSSKVAVNKLETQVGNRPFASIAVAFGVGLLAAQLIRRK